MSDIYDAAAALISEQPDGADNTDLRERATPLLFQIISELTPLDRAVGGEGEYPSDVPSLDDPFPLCDGLAHICAYKLAYLLAADENGVLYPILRAEYDNAKKTFIDSLQGDVSKIKNVYA